MQKRTAVAPPKPPLCEDGLLRIFPEAARFLGVGRSKIFALLQDGHISYVRLPGGERRVPRRALVEFAERLLVSAERSG